MTGKEMTWLCELLSDAQASPRLTGFEGSFIESIDRRVIRIGAETVLSDAQMAVLRKIEEKIHATG